MADQAHNSSGRLPGLDGLRALSVIAVVYYHASLTTQFGRSTWINNIIPVGAMGVTVFFVLSGFLITWLLQAERRRMRTVSLSRFYTRRAFRILPPAFFYLLVLCVLAHAGLVVVPFKDILYSAFFCRNYVGESGATAHFWSLAVEEQFYLFWPLLFLLMPPRRLLLLTAILIPAHPLWHALIYRVHWRIDFGFDGILTGCLLALLRDDARYSRFLRTGLLKHPLFVLLSAILVIACYTDHNVGSAVLKVFIPIPFIGVIVNYVLEAPQTMVVRMLEWRALAWTGRLSYSLYIWQQLFCWERLHGLPWTSRMPQCVLLTLCAAAFSYYVIEQPALRLRDRLMKKRPVERPTLAFAGAA